MNGCPTPTKRAYDNEADAWRHAYALRRRGGSVDIKAYRCRCGKWHAGHSVSSLMYRIRRARRVGRA